eukprot:TRINITY_DN43713_c0_g1_i1.p1 TRINITY_DN43713_c0_g1~~TRINITY_DN43713_c0_g1_i1.p1  ORF type:complete len:283 (+),score=61.43 TRINITY_DN43713_c0_g1_i1:85-933(+)
MGCCLGAKDKVEDPEFGASARHELGASACQGSPLPDGKAEPPEERPSPLPESFAKPATRSRSPVPVLTSMPSGRLALKRRERRAASGSAADGDLQGEGDLQAQDAFDVPAQGQPDVELAGVVIQSMDWPEPAPVPPPEEPAVLASGPPPALAPLAPSDEADAPACDPGLPDAGAAVEDPPFAAPLDLVEQVLVQARTEAEAEADGSFAGHLDAAIGRVQDRRLAIEGAAQVDGAADGWFVNDAGALGRLLGGTLSAEGCIAMWRRIASAVHEEIVESRAEEC